jgi:hypothetical protein
MSNPERRQKAASGRMLDDGTTSGRKEMGDKSGMITSNSKDILRKFLHAGVGSDRRLTPVAVGKRDPQMGSVVPRHISPV